MDYNLYDIIFARILIHVLYSSLKNVNKLSAHTISNLQTQVDFVQTKFCDFLNHSCIRRICIETKEFKYILLSKTFSDSIQFQKGLFLKGKNLKSLKYYTCGKQQEVCLYIEIRQWNLVFEIIIRKSLQLNVVDLRNFKLRILLN